MFYQHYYVLSCVFEIGSPVAQATQKHADPLAFIPQMPSTGITRIDHHAVLCSDGDRPQGFMHFRQMCFELSHTLSIITCSNWKAFCQVH